MRYIIIGAVLLAYVGAAFAHGIAITSAVFALAGFVAFVAYATNPQRRDPLAVPSRPHAR